MIDLSRGPDGKFCGTFWGAGIWIRRILNEVGYFPETALGSVNRYCLDQAAKWAEFAAENLRCNGEFEDRLRTARQWIDRAKVIQETIEKLKAI